MKYITISTSEHRCSEARKPISQRSNMLQLPFYFLGFLIIFLMMSSCREEIATTSVQSNQKFRKELHALYQQKKFPNTALGIRDGGKLSVNDGIDYINESLNFLYCRPDDYFQETMIFQDTFSIPVSAGEIDASDLNDAIENIAEFAGDQFSADTRTKKEPLMFDVRQVGSPSPSYINVEGTFIFEADSPLETIDEYPYEDSWVYGSLFDASELCSEEGANADAVDLFRRDLRKSVEYRSKLYHYYFTDPYIVCFSPDDICLVEEIPISYYHVHIDETLGSGDLLNGDDDVENDNLFDFLLFSNFSGFLNFDECLSSDEMNFYYEQMHDLALDILPSPVGNKAISQLEVGFDLFTPDLESVIWHSMIVVESNKTVVTEEEYEEALPLP